MRTLREVVADARSRKVAVGHFNFSNLEGVHAIAKAAQLLHVPVIVGTSEGEEGAVGTDEAVALVKTIREHYDIEIFLNADHHYSFEKVKESLDAGYDAAIFDGAALSYEENVALAKKCVAYARSLGRDVLLEGELGFIGQSSKILDSIPEGVVTTTNPLQAKDFVERTGVDMLAPAVGNFHGLLRTKEKPRLNIDCIKNISTAVHVPLVLHGGSGEDKDVVAAIDAGISIVHVNTELRKAYTEAERTYLTEHPDEVAPYKYGAPAAEAMQEVVLKKLKQCNKLS